SAPEKVGQVRQFVGHAQRIWPVAFSPDGRLILTGASFPDTQSLPNDVQLWDTTTGQEVGRLIGHTSAIYCATFSADGTRVGAGSVPPNNACTVWDVRSGKALQHFTHTPGGHIRGVAFAPDGAHIFSTDGTVRMWDVETGKEVKRFHGHENVLCLALS